MPVVSTLVARLRLDSRQFNRGLDEAEGKTKGLGRSIGGVGTIAAGAVVAGIGAMTAAIVKSSQRAQEFEKQFRNINSILQLSDTHASELRKTVADFGANSPLGIKAVADAYYDIVSGVQDVSTHMAILQASESLSIAGQSELRTTTSALIDVMNSYGLSAEQASMASDVLAQSVKMGKTTMDQFTGAFPKALPLAQELGFTLDDVASAMSFMTTQGLTASEAGTKVVSLLTGMVKPGNELGDVLDASANGFGSFREEVQSMTKGGASFLDVIAEMNERMDGDVGLLGRVESITGALSLLNPSFKEFDATFKGAREGATENAKAIQEEALAFDTLRSNIDGVVLALGDVFLPVLRDMARDLSPAILAFRDWIAESEALEAVARTLHVVFEGIGLVLDIIMPMVTAFADGIGGLVNGFLDFFGIATDTSDQLKVMGEDATATGVALQEMSATSQAELGDVTAAIKDGVIPAVEGVAKALDDTVVPTSKVAAESVKADLERVKEQTNTNILTVHQMTTAIAGMAGVTAVSMMESGIAVTAFGNTIHIAVQQGVEGAISEVNRLKAAIASLNAAQAKYAPRSQKDLYNYGYLPTYSSPSDYVPQAATSMLRNMGADARFIKMAAMNPLSTLRNIEENTRINDQLYSSEYQRLYPNATSIGNLYGRPSWQYGSRYSSVPSSLALPSRPQSTVADDGWGGEWPADREYQSLGELLAPMAQYILGTFDKAYGIEPSTRRRLNSGTLGGEDIAPTVQIDTVNINANDAAGGEAAGEAFADRLNQLLRTGGGGTAH